MVLSQPSIRRTRPYFTIPSLLLAVVNLLRGHIDQNVKNVDIAPAKSPVQLIRAQSCSTLKESDKLNEAARRCFHAEGVFISGVLGKVVLGRKV